MNKCHFQHTKLLGADLQSAKLVGSSIDLDTVLEGAIIDEGTDFDLMKVMRPTSRLKLFEGYAFKDGILHRQSSRSVDFVMDQFIDDWPVEESPAQQNRPTALATKQVQHLMQNAVVTRLTAQQFAGQIEEILHGIPAANGNKLVEPLQTMLEFAEVLRNLAPVAEPPTSALDLERLEERIAELEALVERLTTELSDESKARQALEEIAKSDGFRANFRRSAGKAAGYGVVGAAVSVVTVGVPGAAVLFLGAEHPVVTTFLKVIGQLQD